MKKMRKVFLFVTGLLLLVVLSACNKSTDGNYFADSNGYTEVITLKNNKGGYVDTSDRGSITDAAKVKFTGKNKITIGEAHRTFKTLDKKNGFKLDSGTIFYKEGSDEAKQLVKENKENDEVRYSYKSLIKEANRAAVRKGGYLTTEIKELSNDSGKGYKVPKAVNKLKGNYEFQDKYDKIFLTINKNGTYTMFDYSYAERPKEYGNKTRRAVYIDRNNNDFVKKVNNQITSGVVYQEYGDLLLTVVDEADQAYLPNENGKLEKMSSRGGLYTAKDFKESIPNGGSNTELGDSMHSNSLKESDGKLSVDINGDERNRDWITFKKISNKPVETSQSTYELFTSLKKPKEYTSSNQYYQYTSSKTYRGHGYDISKLQDGYTSDNKKVKVKYAYVSNNVIYATDGKKTYSCHVIDDRDKLAKRQFVVKKWD